VLPKSLSNHRKLIEFGALLVLAGLIIWLFGRKLDWHQVKVSVEQSDWRLILIAIVIILLAYLWRVTRWQALLKPLTPTSIREVWIATCVGFAAVLTIGRAGEVVRPLALPMRDRRVRQWPRGRSGAAIGVADARPSRPACGLVRHHHD
jgi:hypothetical protein